MSHETIIYGCILAPAIRSHVHAHLLENINIINNLPLEDVYPPLTRNMFHIISNLQDKAQFDSQLIKIGASIKEFEGTDWEEWLTKFQNLLRKLFWSSVHLQVITELGGSFEYKWSATSESVSNMFATPPQPITAWQLSKLEK